MKKKGLCFICSIFVVRDEIKVTLLMSSFSSILFRFFLSVLRISQYYDDFFVEFDGDVATPLWPSVGVKPNTSKVGDLESSGSPECLEFDSRDQNTSH
jgi:hypothetical protein